MDIDVVITWVDGSDPVLAKKRASFGNTLTFQDDDVAGATRFASVGEIYWCVASIRKFAPFVRKIFIVTDGQDPHVPEGSVPVEIVDHKTLFRGYESALPVFNSLALETMTWRIPGLSEHYIEMNDDFMFCRPVSVSDLYTEEGFPVCYTSRSLLRHSIPVIKLTRALKKREHGHRRVTFKGLMANAAILGGSKFRVLRLNHAPRPLLKSVYEKYYSEHPEQLEHNISFRFRDSSQFHPAELQYIILWREHRLKLLPVRGNLFCMEPKQRRNYVDCKMSVLKRGSYMFCCFNSLDKASDEDLAKIRGWIEKTIA